MKGGQLGPTLSLLFMFHCCSSYYTTPFISLLFVHCCSLRCCSFYFVIIHVSLILLMFHCCSSCFVAPPTSLLFLLHFIIIPPTLLFLLLHYCSYFASLLLLVLHYYSCCFTLLFLLLHYSCCFVAPPSCIATMWCFVIMLPSQVPFYPLLVCYYFVLHASLLFNVSLFPCPNWYSSPPLFL